MAPPAERSKVRQLEKTSGPIDHVALEPRSFMPARTAICDFMVALARDLQIRDVRAAAVLLVLQGNERSIPGQPGLGIKHLADRIGESEETCRHIVRGLQAGGWVMRCARIQRTHLFCITLLAEQKLRACLDCLAAGAADRSN